MKKYIFYLISLLFIVSCTPKLERVVEDAHPDGNPRLVVYYKMEDGFREKVKVEAFYEDGTQHYVGEFADQKRNGSWTYWYKNGNKWSDGYFKNDLRDGNGTTWHKNGQKNYDCSYTEGVRTGVWKFYDPEGNFLKEVNYEE